MEALSQQLCQDYRVDQSAQAVEALRREKHAYKATWAAASAPWIKTSESVLPV